MATVRYLSGVFGFPEDQVRCFLLLIVAYPLGLVFNSFLSYKSVSVNVRHLYSMCVGFSFSLYCFGLRDTLALILAVGVAYLLLVLCSPRVVHWYMMAYGLLCVILAHTYRMILNYGSWNVDYTGPLMMIILRIVYVSCELHDGSRPDEELTQDQRNLKITQIPSVLEFASYNFSFVCFLAGPACPYKEYIDFIAGSNMKLIDNPNRYARAKEHAHDPSPLYPVIIKSMIAFVNLLLYVALGKFCSKKLITNPHLNLPLRMCATLIFMIHIRCFYYFIFYIGESVCNISGLGFRGYDDKGYAQWDLVKNVDVFSVELPLNMRSVTTCWHIMTSNWLRRCVYERVPLYPTMCTFMVSALWHGPYPGYIMCFTMFSVSTTAARKLRNLLHYRFQKPGYIKLTYDLCGMLVTGIWRDYCAIPFVLLTFQDTLTTLNYYYHIPLMICIILTLLPVSKQKKKTQ